MKRFRRYAHAICSTTPEQLTSAGNELRTKVEDLTDELAYAPWRTVPDDDVQELVTLGEVDSGRRPRRRRDPGNAFGPRYGQHR